MKLFEPAPVHSPAIAPLSNNYYFRGCYYLFKWFLPILAVQIPMPGRLPEWQTFVRLAAPVKSNVPFILLWLYNFWHLERRNLVEISLFWQAEAGLYWAKEVKMLTIDLNLVYHRMIILCLTTNWAVFTSGSRCYHAVYNVLWRSHEVFPYLVVHQYVKLCWSGEKREERRSL